MAGCGGLGSFGGLVQLALLTAMRRGELSGLRWSDIKSDRIVLEAQHTKTGAAHEVPLTELMREVLARQPRTSSTFVFPSSQTNTRISGWTKLVKRLIKSSGVDLTMHDTRRTCRTLMSRLEFPRTLETGHRPSAWISSHATTSTRRGRAGSMRSRECPNTWPTFETTQVRLASLCRCIQTEVLF